MEPDRNTRRILVSFSRVQETARRTRADASDVLGYVIAHEIAHVLMPDGSHAPSGVMQQSVDQGVIAHNRLSFGSDEAQLIRAALARDPIPLTFPSHRSVYAAQRTASYRPSTVSGFTPSCTVR